MICKKNLSSNNKLLADDAFIFSSLKNINVSTGSANTNFKKMKLGLSVESKSLMTMDSWIRVFHSFSRKKCHLILILKCKLTRLFFLEKE